MSRTLGPSALSRVRALGVTVGPLGANVSFEANAHAEDVIVLVAEVERAIREHSGVHELNDPQLRAGHWFQVRGIPMIYGVPYGIVGGVMFLGPVGPVHPSDGPGGLCKTLFEEVKPDCRAG